MKILMNDELAANLLVCFCTTVILKRHLKCLSPPVIWEWFDIAIFYNMKNRVSGIKIFI